MLVISAALCVATVLFVTPVWGSIFGEENVTLVQILAQMIEARETLSDISNTASVAADMTHELLTSYQAVNAGIAEIRNYSTGAFLRDLQTDLYNQYPGIGQLAFASRNFDKWATTRTRSPFTAYQAISAVLADVSQPLRDDIASGRANVDQELILSSEAAGGFAAAHTAEQATEKFDREIKDLHDLAERASPAQAEQVQARAALMVAAQQGYVVRLLSRAVRLDSMNAALAYGARISSKNAMADRRSSTVSLAQAAASGPRLLQFGDQQ